MQLRGVRDFTQSAIRGILDAAALIDAGEAEVDEGNCPRPNCSNSLLAGFIRSERSPRMCDLAEELWSSGGFRVAKRADGSWLEHSLARSSIAEDAKAALAEHQAAGVNVLVSCTYEPEARALINVMEAMNYSVFAFITSVGVSGGFTWSVQEHGWWQGEYTLGTAVWDYRVPTRGVFSGLTSEEFRTRYRARWNGEVDYRGASQFAAYCVLAAAVEAAGTLDTEAVRMTLQRMHLSEF
eukprot:641962-Prymnesium_polylepis.2